jgi:3-deoxy-manno-octulosonate cytidylyltransferase (CMP-KDO synthetase)
VKTIGVIPARFGSKRLVGKPLVSILGKPLIYHVYKQAKKSKLLNEILVATDDKRIKTAVEGFGGKALLTSPELPTGTDRVAQAVKYLNCDIVLNIQCDEAFLNPKMLDQLIKFMQTDKKVQMGTLARKIKEEKKLSDPNVVKVVLDKNNFALYFSRLPIPYLRDHVKKKPDYYQHIGIYAFRKNFLMKFAKLKSTPLEKSEKLEQLRTLENGFKIKVRITEYNSFSIDSENDLRAINRGKN